MTDLDDLARRANAPVAYNWSAPDAPHVAFCCGHTWTLQEHHREPRIGDEWTCPRCNDKRHITAIVGAA